MPKIRIVEQLKPEEKETLAALWSDPNESDQKYDLDEDTVSATIKNWESCGIVGLFEGKRPGRPPIYSEEDAKEIIEFIKLEPRQIKVAKEKIERKTGKKSSIKTIKRVAKKLKLNWKRVKRTTKEKPDKKKYDAKKSEIMEYAEKEKNGDIALYFFDCSGFSLTSNVPYAWQEIAKHIEIPTSRSKQLNVLGFLSKMGSFYSYITESTVDTDVLIATFNEFAKNIKIETHVYIDNAPMHRSKKFLQEIQILKKRSIHVHFLTPYSPQLNAIEILWRFIKYSWLDLSSFLSFKNLKDNLFNVLGKIEDGEYRINFV